MAGHSGRRSKASPGRISRRRVTDEDRALYLNLRDQGLSKSAAAGRIGVSAAWATKFERDLAADPNEALRLRRLKGVNIEITPPKDRHELSDLALRCLDDFALFRATVFGRQSMPWAEEAAHEVARRYESPEREFVVINVAPGAGKTTLFSLDIPAWLTCRSRAIRGLLGHAVERKAIQYTGRLRRELERVSPLRATAEAMEKRGQMDATHTMAQLFGRFKAPEPDIWRREAFTVEQIGSWETGEKEASWAAVSMEGEFIGDRVDFVIFDDAVTPRRARSEDMREHDREVWDKVVEARIEPGGLVMLVGQRIHQQDLYRYCLDKTFEIEVDGFDEPQVVRKYHHIVYRAHDTDICKGDHGLDAEPWRPDGKGGCLLDPKALPWKGREGLDALQKADAHKFQIEYQQDDTSHNDSLVQKLWIDGGRDPDTGQIFPGCWDVDRDPGEIPDDLQGRVISYATVDPSASNWWVVMWRLYEVDTGRRILVDMHRAKMTANQLLDHNPVTGVYTGLMEDWQRRSERMGRRITDWVIEHNSQQKWLSQYAFMRSWFQRNGVRQFGHETSGKSKGDPKLGFEQTLPNLFELGLLRLPGTTRGKVLCRPLVTEACSYPYHTTDDCLMCLWFGEYVLPVLLDRNEKVAEQYEWRPSWMGGQPELAPAEARLARLAGVA